MYNFDEKLQNICALYVGRQIYERWGMCPTFKGTRALLICAAVAAAQERKGAPWSARKILEDYAAWRKERPGSVLAQIRRALQASGNKVGPLGAIIILAHTPTIGAEDDQEGVMST